MKNTISSPVRALVDIMSLQIEHPWYAWTTQINIKDPNLQ